MDRHEAVTLSRPVWECALLALNKLDQRRWTRNVWCLDMDQCKL